MAKKYIISSELLNILIAYLNRDNSDISNTIKANLVQLKPLEKAETEPIFIRRLDQLFSYLKTDYPISKWYCDEMKKIIKEMSVK